MVQKIYLAGEWIKTDKTKDVINPYSQEIVDSVYVADVNYLDKAVNSALKVYEKTKKLKTYQKSEALKFIASELSKRKEELAKILSEESGKPITEALGEIDRGVSTFNQASEVLNTWTGEIMNLDITPVSGDRQGIIKRFPMGVIFGISPYNFPLNLVAHKVAPAIATGNPIILKPASSTPLTALKLAEIFDKTNLPKEMFQVIMSDRETADKLIDDPRISMLSFTGSPEVGWDMKNRAGKKKVVLELGGDAVVYVHRDADIDFAIDRLLIGGFANAGQICISVQRLLVHEEIYDKFINKFIESVKELKVGNQLDKETKVGPMIDSKNTRRILDWISEAKDSGAKILLGGNDLGNNLVEPTLIENPKKNINITKKEAFGPIVNIYKVSNSKEAFEKINESDFGLQTGIFTNNQQVIFDSFEDLDVGGVIVNDIPTFRVDNMPYGGVKDSGFGREGLKYAMEDMTELKVMVINRNKRYENE